MYINFINIETESRLEMRSNFKKKMCIPVVNYLNKYQSYWNQRISKGKPMIIYLDLQVEEYVHSVEKEPAFHWLSHFVQAFHELTGDQC